jgi:hypothetical protein
VVATTFLPRNGPTDVRVFDASGREVARVPDSAGRCLTITASPDGAYSAAEIAFSGSTPQKERGVIVFDLAKGTSWTYGWHYGSDAEPLSWELENRGVLAVRLSRGTRRFNSAGRAI